MGHCLVADRVGRAEGFVSRFDPVYWTVNFPRPMMAAVTTPAFAGAGHAADALRVDCVFYRQDDLAGLIWESADRHDHPLLAYETARDFRGCRLAFRWRSAGVRALDAVNGPVLTIEGRDAGGAPRSWYVRLWNYATGTPEDAQVAIDFAGVDGGFLLPPEADAVWAGDVDRMFVSLVPAGYTGADAALAAPAEAWVELSGVRCEGAGAVLRIGDAVLPEHGLGIAGGYDDSYNLTPERVLGQALRLGYRGQLVHYVGMSHYFRLAGGVVTLAGGALNVACAAWHRDFAARAKALGYDIVWSVSYELFDAHCPAAWKQRFADGSPALTGWVPPSTLLSPTNAAAMEYVQAVARAFVGIGVAAGLSPKLQVGEPWWWTDAAGRIALYDASALAAFAPDAIATVRGPTTQALRQTLNRAGAKLAASTAALTAAVRADHPACETYLLAYLPTVLDDAAPELRRANLPACWAAPAFDVLQLEDYDWVTAGRVADSAAGAAAAEARLGYPPDKQEYLSGFVLNAADAGQWAPIVAAAQVGARRGVRRAYLWALPQVLRDGLVVWGDRSDLGKDEMQAFDDVLFPLALGREAEVSPEFRTTVVASAGGTETRSAAWAEARTRYDVGPGVRSEADIAQLLGFFRARMGPARAFLLRDPFDSTGVGELLGVGDGGERRFALVRHYGDTVRRVTRPVAGSVRLFLGGVETAGFAVDGGAVVLDAAPATGVLVTGSFTFDVPVRFAEDRLTVTRATFLAGDAPSVPLVEVRE